MNITCNYIPTNWQPKDTKAINKWFKKIQKHLKTETIKFKEDETYNNSTF